MNGDVRCHSVMRRVISELVAIPAAYRQTSGPNGVTRGRDEREREDGQQPANARLAGEEILGKRHGNCGRPEEEAPVEVRPGEHEERDRPGQAGLPVPPGEDCQDRGEEHDPEELGPQAQGGDPDDEGGQRQQRSRARGQPTAAGEQHEPDGSRHQHGPEHRQPAPASEPVDDGEEHDPAPHCWLSHGSPIAVKVKGSVRSTASDSSISSPARTW